MKEVVLDQVRVLGGSSFERKKRKERRDEMKKRSTRE